MDEIQFKFKDCKSEIDRSNALMQWLVNRAFQFDKTKYNKICLHLEDTVQSCVAIEMCFIINTYTNVKFYVPRKEARNCRSYQKNPIIKTVSMRKWNKLSNQLDTMRWDVQSTHGDYYIDDRGAKIYHGISVDSIYKIGVNLYGWVDSRKEYLSNLKKAIKLAEKRFKEERKQAKEAMKNANTDNKR